MVAGAGDVEASGPAAGRGPGPAPGSRALFLYNASAVQRTRRSALRSRRPCPRRHEAHGVHPGWMTRTRDAATPRATRSSRVLSLIAWNHAPTVRARQRTLRRPHDGGRGPRRLLERGRAEEMRDDGAEGSIGHPREEQRELVDILDDHVRPFRRERPPHRATAEQREARPPAGPLDLDAVDRGPRWGARPARTHQPHPMAPGRSRRKISNRWISAPPACGFSRSCQLTTRMFTAARAARAMLSSTPLTNAGARAPPNQCARRTASSIATLGGTSPRRSSRIPSRRMFRSITAIRLSRQLSLARSASASSCPTSLITSCASASARSRIRGSGPVRRRGPSPPRHRRRALELPGVEQLQRARAALGLGSKHRALGAGR